MVKATLWLSFCHASALSPHRDQKGPQGSQGNQERPGCLGALDRGSGVGNAHRCRLGPQCRFGLGWGFINPFLSCWTVPSSWCPGGLFFPLPLGVRGLLILSSDNLASIFVFCSIGKVEKDTKTSLLLGGMVVMLSLCPPSLSCLLPQSLWHGTSHRKSSYPHKEGCQPHGCL